MSSRAMAINHKQATLFFTLVLATSYWATGLAQDADSTSTDEEDSGHTIELKVSPSTCVALHKRQACRKTISITWPALPIGRYCIHDSQFTGPLKCWQANELNSVAVAYRSATSIRYEIRLHNSDMIIAHATVKTAWVYNTSRRSSSGWRLF